MEMPLVANQHSRIRNKLPSFQHARHAACVVVVVFRRRLQSIQRVSYNNPL